ncbi:hypothetical protein CPU05_05130 [Pediococcus acidilactici]|nr:hypothetical protein CPU05_05130 [Pediococcus acidilactici]
MLPSFKIVGDEPICLMKGCLKMKTITLISALSSVTISCWLAKKMYKNQQFQGVNSAKMHYHYDISAVHKINLYFERGTGTIEQTAREQLKIEYYFANAAQENSFVYTENAEFGQLDLQLKRKNPLAPLNFFDGIFVKVGVPAAYKGQINVKTITGSLRAENLSLEKVSLKSATGDIAVHTLQSNQVLIKTTTGSISIDELVNIGHSANSATFISTTGAITLMHNNKLFTKEIVKTTTGNVHLGIDQKLSDYLITYEGTRKKDSELVGNPVNKIVVKTMAGNVSKF